jgi:phage tail-like protein
MTVRDGWLVEQLPRVMAADPVLHDFVTAFEQVHDTVRERIDAIEYQMDTGLASPEMLQYLGSWLGIELEPTDPAEYRRSMVREVGRLLGWRGTRFGVEALLEAATGARVTVIDAGGVYGGNDQVPPPDPVVVVQMDHTGHLTERQVMGFLQSELPLGAKVRLDVRFQPQPARGRARPVAGGDDDG